MEQPPVGPTDLDFWECIASYRRTVRHHHGRLRPSAGSIGRMDCVGPAFAAMWQLGLPCDDFTAYAEQPDPQVLRAALQDRAEERPFGEWSAVGRLLVLRSPVSRTEIGSLTFRPIHVAYMGPDRVAAIIEDKMRLVTMVQDRVESVWLMRGLRATV